VIYLARGSKVKGYSGGSSLWSGQSPRFAAFHSHGDIFDLPRGAVTLASSEITPVQSYRFGMKAYGILFHLEVTLHHISRMLEEFAGEIELENLDQATIFKQSEYLLPELRRIGATVFERWAELNVSIHARRNTRC